MKGTNWKGDLISLVITGVLGQTKYESTTVSKKLWEYIFFFCIICWWVIGIFQASQKVFPSMRILWNCGSKLECSRRSSHAVGPKAGFTSLQCNSCLRLEVVPRFCCVSLTLIFLLLFVAVLCAKISWLWLAFPSTEP